MNGLRINMCFGPSFGLWPSSFSVLALESTCADWRVPIVTSLKDPGHGAERNVRRLAFKYILIDDELYGQTAGHGAEMYSSSVWILIRSVCLWGKFMKASVVHINRLLK